MDAAILKLTKDYFEAILTKSPITGNPAEIEISGNLQITKDVIFSSTVWR